MSTLTLSTSTKEADEFFSKARAEAERLVNVSKVWEVIVVGREPAAEEGVVMPEEVMIERKEIAEDAVSAAFKVGRVMHDVELSGEFKVFVKAF